MPRSAHHSALSRCPRHSIAPQGRPLEEVLCQSTLWPEVHKLYGHGNDVFRLAACPRGTCLVSAAKAQSAASAELRVWDCSHEDFGQTQELRGHKLTVTQLRFSSDGRLLLSASRDRSVRLYRALHLHGAAMLASDWSRHFPALVPCSLLCIMPRIPSTEISLPVL